VNGNTKDMMDGVIVGGVLAGALLALLGSIYVYYKWKKKTDVIATDRKDVREVEMVVTPGFLLSLVAE